MKVVLASSNNGKIKEIKKLLPEHEVIAYSDILGKFEIVEDGNSFQENAILKAKAVDEKLNKIDYQNYIVISDDSGLTVPVLNNEPGIYSARYAKADASDHENNQKLIARLKELKFKKTPAFYTACLAIAFNRSFYTTHGWMYGDVIDEQKGDNGFGYDPLFVPKGYAQTLGELDEALKKEIGHRAKGLELAMLLIKSLVK